MELQLEQVTKWYLRGRGDTNRFVAVAPLDLTLSAGEVTLISGKSGSGKTTLLHMAAGLLPPSGGTIWTVDAKGADQNSSSKNAQHDRTDSRKINLYALGDGALSRFRNRHMAVIPQAQSTIASLNVLENVLLPAGMYETPAASLKQEAMQLLEGLGIGELSKESPKRLSGGELRRVAVARALLGRPDLIFADEPTSDLDEENTRIVLGLLQKAAQDGAAVLMVSHDPEAAAYAGRHLVMQSGVVRERGVDPHSEAF